jgi:TaqI-like C-terminal specificity domain
VPHTTDLDVTAKEVVELASADALTAFLAKLGYDTADRALLSPEAVGLSGESAGAIKRIELLSEDPERFLRVVFAQPKSLTAKVRNDLVRVLGRSTLDHLLILASDFDTLEFVFLDKRKREQKGPAGGERIQVVPKTVSVNRRSPTRLDLRTLRRFTWTGRDALEQFDKLRSVFDAAAYTGEYFQNRGLFSDHFLRDRLREDAAWRDNPDELFAFVRDLLRDAQARWGGQDKEVLRNQLLEPLFKRLGFKPTVNRPSKTDQTEPDYLLKAGDGGRLTAAFVYAWDRWLDGPDLGDADTPEENPGACVVTALDQGIADWIMVTNGRLWRLYSRQAHARATNFYEVDLVEALTASGDTDPNEAFRYWSLFFRPDAFRSSPLAPPGRGAGREGAACWLDGILQGSREYAKRLGERLKDRIFLTIFPHLAQGFLVDRKQRLDQNKEPTEEELADTFEATLTLLYRLLFLLYAESRDLLPIREAPYHAASLKKIKEEIAGKAGVAESGVPECLQKAYSPKETGLYDRLCRLFRAMDKGDSILNVPTYNGGLFNTSPLPSPPLRGRGAGGEGDGGRRDQRIARFLLEHKVPDRHLALAIDRLARDQDERTLALVFIDYKSLEVRHLGSIYEGLLEFKLKVAEEDLTTQADKKGETYIPLSRAKVKRGKQAVVVVRKKEVYLSNDKAERKASGSYYTPDPIVEYIVAHTVGPVLEEKLEALRPDFRKVRKTFDRLKKNAEANPHLKASQDSRRYALEATYREHQDLVERLFYLRVLDPAMGSGHFLVETVDFVTDHLLKFLNQFPINPVNFALERTRASILESLGEQGVTVDPNKLTDINLLKRHVLKRCIYGVDLNPMAVELAKVSLWLDAFTLGAPLNFLDHHLRCGNSLIGAAFQGLEHAAAGPLFVMQYESLLRAIQHVFFVSNLADATAAEVRRSAEEYAEARRELSGYQIGLDLVMAQHFGFAQAPALLTSHGSLSLTNRKELLAAIKDERERDLVRQVEALASRADLRFFHWELEFPEVFFGYADASQRQVKHRNVLEEGSAGFDCVVGNPPYLGVRTGAIDRTVAGYYTSRFDCAERNWDLSVLFLEASLALLKNRSALGMIVPSRIGTNRDFLPLRQKMFEVGGPSVLIECGAAFEDPSVLASVLVCRRPSPSPLVQLGCRQQDDLRTTRAVPRDVLQTLPDSPFVTPLTAEALDLFLRITKAPTRLGLIAEITRGMECGRNDPHVSAVQRNGMLPVLSGEGIQEFRITPQGLYMPPGLSPASKYKTLQLFRTTPKILIRFVAPHPIAAIDVNGYLNFNTVYNVILHEASLDRYAALACLLNSRVVRWWFEQAFNAAEELFPHIQKYQLQGIPLPDTKLQDKPMQELAKIGRAALRGEPVPRMEMEELVLVAYDLEPASRQLLAPRKDGHAC